MCSLESEGLSISLLEALGCGVAPLVSTIPENTEPLQGLGFSFTNRDVRNLQEKIAWAVRNPDAVHAMGSRVRALAEREYSWDTITDRYEKLYEELLT